MPLVAGFAEIDITPPIGVWMGGYALRPSGCTGVHDPLYARAAVFESAGKAVAIVSMVLIGLDMDIVVAVRIEVQKETGISPHALMLNASHTHGGPLTKSFLCMGSRDPAYIRWLMDRLIEVVKRAAEQPTYQSLAYGRAPVQVGVNRRQYGKNGKPVKIGVNPDGPVMPWVDALVIREGGNHPSAVLFSHACHPTTLGGENLEITADYCGYPSDFIKKKTGGTVFPLFLQGCSGNINPHPRGDFGWAKAHGRALGEAALDAIKHALPLNSEQIDFAKTTVDLELEPPPPLEEFERSAIDCDREAEDARSKGDVGRRMHAEGLRDYALFECEAAALGDEGYFQSAFVI